MTEQEFNDFLKSERAFWDNILKANSDNMNRAEEELKKIKFEKNLI